MENANLGRTFHPHGNKSPCSKPKPRRGWLEGALASFSYQPADLRVPVRVSAGVHNPLTRYLPLPRNSITPLSRKICNCCWICSTQIDRHIQQPAFGFDMRGLDELRLIPPPQDFISAFGNAILLLIQQKNRSHATSDFLNYLYTKLYSDRFKSHFHCAVFLRRKVQFFEPNNLALTVFHQNDLFTCLFSVIFIGRIAKPDLLCIAFTVIIDFYLCHTCTPSLIASVG